MASVTSRELKKTLKAEGFQVFRTTAHRVALAERVRENLIMDSGVTVECGESLSVLVAFRAAQSDFPKASADELFERARALGMKALPSAYTELEVRRVVLDDPNQPDRTLDVHFEVLFAKSSLRSGDLVSELRFAMGVAKQA